MATPKKRTSVSRKGLRRAGQHHKLYRRFPSKCPNCNSVALHGHVCPSCGMYKGKQIFAVPVAAEDESASSESSQN